MNWQAFPTPRKGVETAEKMSSHGTPVNEPLISCDEGLPEKYTVT